MSSRVVVVSHASVLAANQSVYAELESFCDVAMIVPRTWKDELRPRRYRSQRLDRFRGLLVPVATRGIGRPQRHVALVSCEAVLRDLDASFVIIEEEAFSLAAMRWSKAARAVGVPYAVQAAENLPRSMPRFWQRRVATVLQGAAFVLARSPGALEVVRSWGYQGPATVVPHSVSSVAQTRPTHDQFVLGFVGRLTRAKGVPDIVALIQPDERWRVRVAGDGPLREQLAQLGTRCELLGTLAPEQMGEFYRSVSVVVVPSHTTSTWSEQFGRVIVEAQAQGTPVVAYASGEIPWVASLTAAITVPESDVDSLKNAVEILANDPTHAAQVSDSGRAAVSAAFTDSVVAKQLNELISAVK